MATSRSEPPSQESVQHSVSGSNMGNMISENTQVSVMVLDVINQTETMSGIPVTNELQPEAHITSPRRRIRVHIDPPRKSVIVSKHAYLADAMQQSMPSGATRPGLHLSPTQAFSSQIEIDEEWSWDVIGITKRSDHML
ncbi:unnamed protein product [Rhizoctonia solani]|uniref:Uncharacterized protein n=1 Tax=Rhizoctonia solani TaxID=456999 RepID=A0A8H3CCS3_9AGAM|nr:unnamed protein product [Rhizoctonia solani]